MKIAVIGAGSVGGALGTGWARKGHSVVFGVRRPDSAEIRQLLAQAGSNASAAPVGKAAAAGEVVVLATPWPATKDALAAAGSLSGKVVLDCTNPLKPDLSGLDVEPGSSGGEMVASWAPGARVVKIFNTTGSNNMAKPAYGSERATMFYCGDDAGAKATAKELAAAIGFDPVDAGPLRQARLLEPLALLWISLAYPQGMGREIAFRLMRR